MAVPCPECGREYDITLFQFGRTIHCTCGARVGLEKRVGPRLPASESRFIADAMLGRLARWLRLLGFDTAYDPHVADEELVRRGLVEGRHVLTRDRALPEEWRVAHCTVLDGDDLDAQVAEVVERFDLEERIRLFSRCPDCNVALEPVPEEEVRRRVPPRVLELQDAFSRCPGCGRVYWAGSHTERIRRRLHRVLGRRPR